MATMRLLPTELGDLKAEVDACRNCGLWAHATQGVAGSGPPAARLMLVGEQPGNDEDLRGEPFVGPAGRLLRAALDDAGIDIDRVYLTNAVKHFKWVARGKRRIHDKPNAGEIRACLPWLEEEIAAVAPSLVVALGATAAAALVGPGVRVTQQRGEVLDGRRGARVFVTVHPSSILRVTDQHERQDAQRALVHDLASAARLAWPRRRQPQGRTA